MKNVMLIALLTIGVCIGGDAHNAAGVPLQVPVIFAMAVAAARGNQPVNVLKPKLNGNPKRQKRDFNCPKKQKNSPNNSFSANKKR